MERNAFTPQLPLWSFQFKSSSKVEVMTRKEVEARLIVKALKDEAFKQSLLENPKGAIEQAFAIQLPDNITVEVVEETDTTVYLVLPHNPYVGIPEEEIKKTLGMDLQEIAGWVLGQQKGGITEDEEDNAKIIAKAWRDASFKKLLLADPALVMEQELGERIDHVTIQVLEESPERLFIVIPALHDGVIPLNEVDTQHVNLPMVIGSDHRSTDKGHCD